MTCYLVQLMVFALFNKKFYLFIQILKRIEIVNSEEKLELSCTFFSAKKIIYLLKIKQKMKKVYVFFITLLMYSSAFATMPDGISISNTVPTGPTIICPGGGPILLKYWKSGVNYSADWHIDIGSCDGPIIGSGSYIFVSPTETTTYSANYGIYCFFITIFVEQSANAHTPVGPNIVCNGTSTTNLSVSSGYLYNFEAPTSYSWNISPSNAGSITSATINGTTGSSTITWNSNFIGTAQITSQAINSCGYGPVSSPLLIAVNPIPISPIASNNGPVCLGNSISLSASSIPGANYSWTGPNGYTSLEQNPIVSDNSTLVMGGDYTVTASVNGCSNTAATTTVIMNQAVINSSPFVCEGGLLSLTASNIPGASYFWMGPNGFSSIEQNPIVSISASTMMSGIYSVYTNTNGCLSPTPGMLQIIVKPKPSTPIPSNNGPVCLGNNLTLSCPNLLGATFNWTGPNGYIATIQNPTISNSATPSMGGNYYLTIMVDGCASEIGTTIVEINKITSNNNGPVCSGTLLSLSASPITGASYSWTGPNGFSSSQQNPIVSSSVSSIMAGIYSVTSIVNGCTSPNSVTLVSVNLSPTIPVISQNGNQLQSSATSGNQWYNQDGVIIGATSQNYSPTASGNYYVVHTVNGCSSISSNFNYTFLSNDEFSLFDNLKIYPNPTHSVVNIDCTSQINLLGSKIRIVNSLGQLLLETVINQPLIEINLKSIARQGIYFISIIDEQEKKSSIKKIILN